jgi:hypothetical protein
MNFQKFKSGFMTYSWNKREYVGKSKQKKGKLVIFAFTGLITVGMLGKANLTQPHCHRCEVALSIFKHATSLIHSRNCNYITILRFDPFYIYIHRYIAVVVCSSRCLFHS